MDRPRVPLFWLPRLAGWFVGFVCACYPLDGFPEGSCTWEEARAILEQSPELLAYVEQTLAVEPTGFALRLGDHYADLSGQRVAPFTFRAVSKAAPPVTLDLVVEAELTFYDHAGKPVSSGESGRAHQVRQTFSGIQLRPVQSAAPPEPNADAMKRRTAWVQEQDAAIQAATLSPKVIPFPSGNSAFTGEARFLRDTGTKKALRAIVVRATRAKDEKSSFEEQYEFSAGELFLVRHRESDWIMHPENPNASINRVVETSYYFHEGSIYQALEKRYQAGDPTHLEQAGQSAPEQRMALSGAESMQFLSRASRLSLVDTPEALLAVYAAPP